MSLLLQRQGWSRNISFEPAEQVKWGWPTSQAFSLAVGETQVRLQLLAWPQLASILLLLVVRKEACKSSILLNPSSVLTKAGRNIAQVSGGERELRTVFLKPFERACIQSLSIMTAYSSYDGIPAVADKRASARPSPFDMGSN